MLQIHVFQLNVWFLGASTKLRNASISFVMSVRQSGCRMELDSHWTDFNEMWYFRLFRKSVEKSQVPSKSDKNNGYFTRRLFTFMTISRWIVLRMRNVSNNSCTENQDTHTLSVQWLFFRKSCRLWECQQIWWSHKPQTISHLRVAYSIRTPIRTHAPVPTPKHTHTHTHCLFTATVVSCTRFNVTLYVHCPSFCYSLYIYIYIYIYIAGATKLAIMLNSQLLTLRCLLRVA
jgi:hypothetical protein